MGEAYPNLKSRYDMIADIVIKIVKNKVVIELNEEVIEVHRSSFLYDFSKRTLDILGGFVGCLLTLFAFVIIKIVYLKDGDKDPLIFKQDRIGKGGKLIKIYKFRSMVPNAEDVLEKLMAQDENIKNEYLTNKKLENDPRITKFGHKIRKYSIDEFPQFFNVLIGNMTLVGPRPYLPREIEDMGDAYQYIIECKPAITGPWQIGGRSDVSFDDRLAMDIEYVKTRTLAKDIEILFKTVSSVLGARGAK